MMARHYQYPNLRGPTDGVDKSEIKEVGRLNYIFIKLLVASVDSMKCNAGV